VEALLGIALSIGVAVAVGSYANRKGFSFWAYFFFSLVGTPILALITLSVAKARAEERDNKKVDPEGGDN